MYLLTVKQNPSLTYLPVKQNPSLPYVPVKQNPSLMYLPVTQNPSTMYLTVKRTLLPYTFQLNRTLLSCTFWYHTKCKKLSDEIYRVLDENEGLHLFCTGCNRGACKILQSLNAINKRPDKDLGAVKAQVTQVHEDVSEELNGIKQDIVDLKRNGASKIGNASPTGAENVVSGLLDKKKRKLNVVIHNINPLDARSRYTDFAQTSLRHQNAVYRRHVCYRTRQKSVYLRHGV